VQFREAGINENGKVRGRSVRGKVERRIEGIGPPSREGGGSGGQGGVVGAGGAGCASDRLGDGGGGGVVGGGWGRWGHGEPQGGGVGTRGEKGVEGGADPRVEKKCWIVGG